MNNRKGTRGRKIHYMKVPVPVGAKTSKARNEDRGMIIHASIDHLLSTDPKTGKQVFAREGKAVVVNYHSRLGFKPPVKMRTIKLEQR